MLWISETRIGLLVVVRVIGGSTPPAPSPFQVTRQVTVAEIVASVVGVVQSTPQSGGTPAPVLGALPRAWCEPLIPQFSSGVPAELEMATLTGRAIRFTVSTPPSVAVSRTGSGLF